MSADDGRFALGRAAYEEFIGIRLPASGLGYPCDTGLGFCTMDKTLRGRTRASPASGGPRS
jgi:hypothetical protein